MEAKPYSENMKVSVAIPCYNERETITQTIDETLKVAFGCDREVIVIDDGSTDGSADLALTYADVKLIRHKVNRGKGAALRSGIEAASGGVFVIQDADMEYSPAFLPKVVAPIISNKADVVIGSRFLGHYEGMRRSHYLANKFLSWSISLFSHKKITDIMGGQKAFRMQLLKEIPSRTDSFEVDVELVMKAIKRHARVSEVPTPYSYRKSGTTKIGWRDGVSSFMMILRYGL